MVGAEQAARSARSSWVRPAARPRERRSAISVEVVIPSDYRAAPSKSVNGADVLTQLQKRKSIQRDIQGLYNGGDPAICRASMSTATGIRSQLLRSESDRIS